MKYLCKDCNYQTNDNSNFNKHIKARGHTVSIQEKQEKQHQCSKCNKIFAYSSGLAKHKTNNVCQKYNSNKNKEKVPVTIKVLRELVDAVKILSEKLEKQSEQQQINYYNTYSLNKYIIKYYPYAPVLESLKNYSTLFIADDIDSEDEEDIDIKRMKQLLHEYNNKKLHICLGEYLIKNYKKADPAQQSIWNSDADRLNYIIKELIDENKNESVWNRDETGNRTTNKIIKPLLDYLGRFVKMCNDYQTSQIRFQNQAGCDEILNNLDIFSKIKTNIDNNILSTDIIKYIGSHFKMTNCRAKLIK